MFPSGQTTLKFQYPETVHLIQGSNFQFSGDFPTLLWLSGSSKSNVSPLSSKYTELHGILCITLTLTVLSFLTLDSKFTLIKKKNKNQTLIFIVFYFCDSDLHGVEMGLNAQIKK